MKQEKVLRGTQTGEGKKRAHNKIWNMNLSVSNAQTRYSLPTDDHNSDSLVSRPESPIRAENILQMHKDHWHVKKSCEGRKPIVINS